MCERRISVNMFRISLRMCMSVSTDAIRPLALNTDCQAKRVDLFGKVLIYKCCCCCYWFNSVTNQSHRFQLTWTGIRNPFNLHNVRIYLKERWVFDESLGNYKEVGLTGTDMKKESGFRSGATRYILMNLYFGLWNINMYESFTARPETCINKCWFHDATYAGYIEDIYIYPPRNKT